MNVNKVILVGRLTRDPELRTTPSGQTVTSISLATNNFWTDKNGQKQEKTEFHNIVLWGKTAEVAGQYLVKGQEAFFEGRLQTRAYTGKDGVERRTTEIVAETMQFGSKPGAGGGNSNYNSAPKQASPQRNNAAPEKIPTINLDEEQGEIRLEDVPF
ncbi:MAG: Single-stranded DNA-binding protein [Candidatus Moranbacteria bacterium GW2011_GWE1_49_15]|nr:MAG: Single-stranded DNA-binding protein [Candidatus Moranbacteria bacterium GW2011_GWE2_47_10]KKW06812.1 MAG: Single-stranded DNA-binding protein [Candidatus Moranbacteria bacterium GW2011_GWE1_49_15]HBP00981.1 single-stranded DNA-binding protein [Candidatus Moranbacteria bacterium]